MDLQTITILIVISCSIMQLLRNIFTDNIKETSEENIKNKPGNNKQKDETDQTMEKTKNEGPEEDKAQKAKLAQRKTDKNMPLNKNNNKQNQRTTEPRTEKKNGKQDGQTK